MGRYFENLDTLCRKVFGQKSHIIFAFLKIKVLFKNENRQFRF